MFSSCLLRSNDSCSAVADYSEDCHRSAVRFRTDGVWRVSCSGFIPSMGFNVFSDAPGKGTHFFEPVCWYLYNTKVHRKGKKAVSSGLLFVQFGSFSPQVRKKSKEKGGEKSRRTDRARRSRETVSQAQADGSGKSSDQAFSSGTWGSLRSACSSSSSVGK